MQRTNLAPAALTIFLCALSLTMGPVMRPALAQDGQGAAGSALDGNWSAEVDAAAGEQNADEDTGEIVLNAESKKAIQRVNAYFNAMVHLQGRFTQTDANRKETSGKFFVHRPGRLRFEYAKPSLMRIVSDGQYLSIEDHDLKTVDKYPLGSTPFRMLLTEEVDLIRDAKIMGFANDSDQIVLTLQDRSEDSAGQIKLFFKTAKKSKNIELKEWIITDPQGLDTRIQVADLVKGKEVSGELFNTSTVEFPDFNN